MIVVYTLDGAINRFLSRFTCFSPVHVPASQPLSAGRAMFEDSVQVLRYDFVEMCG